MKPFHIVLAVLVTTISGIPLAWGIAFVVSKTGIENFSPAQLTVLRFCILTGVAIVALPLYHFWLRRNPADHMQDAISAFHSIERP